MDGGRGGRGGERRRGKVKGTGWVGVNYVHCRTGKGNLQSWRSVLDDRVDPECLRCGRYAETGRHVALVRTHGEAVGRRWGT